MVMIWIQSVVNRTPDGPSFDSATSATAGQAVLVAQITNWRSHGLALTVSSQWEAEIRPRGGEQRPTGHAFPKRGVSNQQMVRARLGPLTPAMPWAALPRDQDETRRTDGQARQARVQNFTPLKLEVTGGPGCWSESQ